MTSKASQYKVIKTMAPSRHGALKLAERFGQKLVCVRHRVDPTGTTRLTTVELVVERTPIHRRSDTVVTVRIGFGDRASRAAAIAAGATWDRDAKVWRMPLRVARALNLQEWTGEES
ncbi:hypothetical protein FN976_18530 [Caenimonas sedimenti]|uniref:Uncharacterized protein n=1 Tax=Caenimonas sedimenti TaxID=2596921 RepID=A0A562ZNT7_9BURK|nr:hypothetical protein [Caenimonas sedimenti]TWO69814.1 hypothetical protein FN976_18530 [Caenimonas sedimenti]